LREADDVPEQRSQNVLDTRGADDGTVLERGPTGRGIIETEMKVRVDGALVLIPVETLGLAGTAQQDRAG